MSRRVGVVVFPGSNCEHDVVEAMRLVGADAELLWHGDATVAGVDAVIVPGGFAHGDYLRPGAIARFSPVMGAVAEFAAAGGPVVGICNGFQVLLQTGLLLADADGSRQATLAHNTSGRFVDRWVGLRNTGGPCVFLQGLESFELPVAHAEGRFATRSATDFARLDAAGQLPLRYAGGSNPNGAEGDVAGACDPTGRVFGLMPHPERFVVATQHPAWHGRLDPDQAGTGLAMFVNAVRAVS